MIGAFAKAGIEATFQKIGLATKDLGNDDTVIVSWGSKASFGRVDSKRVLLTLPNISDTANITHKQFTTLVGYAVHEYGHLRHTQLAPWESAISGHGDAVLLSRLINGLEDPRIEQAVINDRICQNARELFESLAIEVLLNDYEGGDYVEPDDVNNISFQCAIEGRRRNGYLIPAPPVYQRSIYGKAIDLAIDEARRCTNTAEIVDVALKLYAAIKNQQQQQQQQKQQKQQQQQQQQQQQDDQGGQQQGDQQDDQGDQSQDKQQGQSDDQGDQRQDQQGNQPGDQPGDRQADQQGQPTKDGGAGRGEGKPIDPSDAIFGSFAEVSSGRAIPAIQVFRKRIEWR